MLTLKHFFGIKTKWLFRKLFVAINNLFRNADLSSQKVQREFANFMRLAICNLQELLICATN